MGLYPPPPPHRMQLSFLVHAHIRVHCSRTSIYAGMLERHRSTCTCSSLPLFWASQRARASELEGSSPVGSGLLGDSKRFNVAVTRAQALVVVVSALPTSCETLTYARNLLVLGFLL